MNIELYFNASESIKVDKDITKKLDITGTYRLATSITNPIITFEGDLEDYTEVNYMFIPDFKRYYYITDIRSVRNNLIEVTAVCDVLMSFKDEIKANKGIIARQENDWNLYVDDGTFKTYQDPIVLTKSFPSGFTGESYLLAISGS